MWGLIYSVVVVVVSVQAVLALPVPWKRAGDFAADPSINAMRIFEAAQEKIGNPEVLATFPSGPSSGNAMVDIYGDWFVNSTEQVFYFTADMDVDCDGVYYKCSNNPDGQPLTSFGRLDASKVPYYVIPESFFQDHRDNIMPNALGAIICGGKMFYGILGDTNGAKTEVIGEASILMAQTCFPNEGISGDNGHVEVNVLYMVFGNKALADVGDTTIDIGALKALGDEQVRKLAQTLGV